MTLIVIGLLVIRLIQGRLTDDHLAANDMTTRLSDYLKGVLPMIRNHIGDAILEWVVLGVLVIAVVGVVAYSIATAGATEGSNLESWIDGINVPSSP